MISTDPFSSSSEELSTPISILSSSSLSSPSPPSDFASKRASIVVWLCLISILYVVFSDNKTLSLYQPANLYPAKGEATNVTIVPAG